jgi:hypothetical protein
MSETSRLEITQARHFGAGIDPVLVASAALLEPVHEDLNRPTGWRSADDQRLGLGVSRPGADSHLTLVRTPDLDSPVDPVAVLRQAWQAEQTQEAGMTDTTDPATKSTKRTSRLGGWFSRLGRDSTTTPPPQDTGGAAAEPGSEADSVDWSRPADDAPAADPGWLLHDGETDGYDGWLYHFADGVTVTEDGEVVELAATQPEAQPETAADPQAQAEPEPEPDAVAEPQAEAAPEIKAAPQTETQPDAVAEFEAGDEPESDAEPNAQSQTEADAQLVLDLEAFTEATAAPEAGVKPEDDTDEAADTEVDVEPKPDYKDQDAGEDTAEAEAAASPEAEPEPEPEEDADDPTEAEADAEDDDEAADTEAQDKTEPEPEAPRDSEPEAEAETQPEAAVEPEPEAETQLTPEQTDEADFPSFVEYSPSHLPLYALGAVFVAASVISVLMIFLAVQDGTTNSLLRAGAVLVIALAAAWLILGWEPTVVSVRDGLLEVSHGSRGQKADLRDPHVIAESSGKPGSPAWKLTVRRPEGKPIVVRGYQVHRRPFARIVAWHQSHPHAEED